MSDPYYIFYQATMMLSLFASTLVFILLWRHRDANGAKAMLSLAGATFIWTLGFLLESHSDTLSQQLLLNNIGYLGSLSVPVAWFVFSVNYIGDKKHITLKNIVLLSVIPLTSTILIWTNNWHHLMWYDEHLVQSGPFTVTSKTYGVFFWISLAYNYILILIGSFILIRRLFVGIPLYTRQAVSLVVAVSLPLLWNIIYVFNMVPLPRKDLTPVMFAISGLSIAYGLMRFHLFLTVPFARKFLIHQLRDGILVFDTRNCLIEINPKAMTVLDINTYAIGKTTAILAGKLPMLEKMLTTGSGDTEVTLNLSDKEYRYELELIPMNDNSGRKLGNLVILRDITERKEMQEQLIAQDRLAAIGELTSGVAHEINNPLAVIKGYTELLLKQDFPAEDKADLNIINSEVDRAAKIVANLLAFARKQPEEKTLVDINDIIKKTLELRAYEQKSKNIQVITEFTPGLPRIMGSELQLRQVFLNIIINAEYFMTEAHGKGILRISTEKSGNFIRIYCSDDGPGIPQVNLKRIFSPFFTTKEVGKGTGLGLSICHGIITEHGGNILVESPPGKGATFIIILPVNRNTKPAAEET